MITDCESCQRKSVPCSATDGAPPICYRCQGDVDDPYCELEEVSKMEKLEAENYALRGSLRVTLALMESDVDFKYINCGPTRQRVMTEARALVPKVT